MNHRYLAMVLVLYFLSANESVLAQEKTISGTIADSDSQGGVLPGANVTVKGTLISTLSDAAGKYSLVVPDKSKVLVFSFIGYRTREVKLGNQSVLDVKLEVDVIRDYWGVATALNIVRTTNVLQYSLTQLSGDDFTQARELNMASQLQGRVAGVNVSKTASGLAGSTRVIIRGAKSVGGLNQPLYVIDGIPMDNANFGQSSLWGGPDYGDGLTSMSPDDIASITVLKGVSSTALYGSRGANGVILISTKKSSVRKGIGIEFNTNLVTEHVINYIDLQHSNGAGELTGPTLATRVAAKAAVLDGTATGAPDRTTAFNGGWNSQGWGPRFDGTNVVQPDGIVRVYSYKGDNFKRFFETGIQASNSIALSGGNEHLNLRFSYSNLRSTAVVPNSGFNRDNFTLSAASKLGRRVTLGGKVIYSKEDVRNRPMISDSPGNAVQAVYVVPGDQDIAIYKQGPKLGAVPAGMTTPDGKNPGEEFQATSNRWGQNPYWAAHQYINSDKRDRVTASANLRYDLTDFLYVTGQAGIDGYKKTTQNLTPQVPVTCWQDLL
jgi:TonB-dependent SusC/RagA subfamily outer membrane receptor